MERSQIFLPALPFLASPNRTEAPSWTPRRRCHPDLQLSRLSAISRFSEPASFQVFKKKDEDDSLMDTKAQGFSRRPLLPDVSEDSTRETNDSSRAHSPTEPVRNRSPQASDHAVECWSSFGNSTDLGPYTTQRFFVTNIHLGIYFPDIGRSSRERRGILGAIWEAIRVVREACLAFGLNMVCILSEYILSELAHFLAEESFLISASSG